MKKPNLLFHKDVLALLHQSKREKRDRTVQLISGVRRNFNSDYRGVVEGRRPSRAAAKDQRTAAKLSRQNAKDYWLWRMHEESGDS